MGLLPFDEVRRRLRIVGQSYGGIHESPVERIVGSVDRSADFDRDFKTRRSRSRLAALRAVHGYDLARAGDCTLPPAEEVAADWYDNVYLPGVAAVDRAGLRELYPFKTEADLFLWIYERHRDLRVLDPDADFDAAAGYAAREGVARRDRRVIEQEKAKPL
jgi:hypothetical protein